MGGNTECGLPPPSTLGVRWLQWTDMCVSCSLCIHVVTVTRKLIQRSPYVRDYSALVAI